MSNDLPCIPVGPRMRIESGMRGRHAEMVVTDDLVKPERDYNKEIAIVRGFMQTHGERCGVKYIDVSTTEARCPKCKEKVAYA